MNAPLRFVVLSLSILALGACASTRSAYVAPERTTHRPGDVIVVTDDEYVSYVERTARRRGIGVTWVNPPSKRKVIKD